MVCATASMQTDNAWLSEPCSPQRDRHCSLDRWSSAYIAPEVSAATHGTMRAWTEAIEGRHRAELADGEPVRVGVIPGEGIGPEVIDAAIVVLTAACAKSGRRLDLRAAGASGPVNISGSLAEADADLCRRTFAAWGAMLMGPHGGRWVYELRRRFDLFCKISPLRPAPELDAVPGPISPAALDGVDILVVREQTGGLYQGRWGETDTAREGRVAEHSFSYTGREVSRIIEVAVALAGERSGRVAVVVKKAGIPSISRLWQEIAEEISRRVGVELEVLDIDFAAYQLLHDPRRLDVVVAPNLFGDLLADAGGALLGSRGLCFGGSFDAGRAAVYQTNHGAAYDIAGSDRANPIGQIRSAAMMLRESFALGAEAELVELAVAETWRRGCRTEDIAEPGCTIVGTREITERIAECVLNASTSPTRSASDPARTQ